MREFKIKDKKLGAQLLKALDNLEDLVQQIGPQTLRHVLDYHVVEARKALCMFDQELYESEDNSTGGLAPPRFIATHFTEPGYAFVKEVEDWIARQEKPEEWYVMQVIGGMPNKVFECYNAMEEWKVQRRIDEAVRQERRRINNVLGTSEV